MNRHKREVLKTAMVKLTSAAQLIKVVKEDEEFSKDNMPETLQGSMQYDKLEENVEVLEGAIEAIEEVMSELSEL